jgi:nucleotide-binding universal stress UspA family protein
MTPKHIVVATDLTPTSAAALRQAVALAAPLGAQVTLVFALEPTPTPPGLEAFALEGMPIDWELRVSRARTETAERHLTELAAAASTPAVQVQPRLFTGRLPEALIEQLGPLGADLLVVGTHGRRGLSHLLLGSVAERLLRAARCPVLCVHPDLPAPPS